MKTETPNYKQLVACLAAMLLLVACSSAGAPEQHPLTAATLQPTALTQNAAEPALLFLRRGSEHFVAGEYLEAISDYSEAISKGTDQKLVAEAYFSRGICRKMLDQHAESLSDYDQSILLAPTSWLGDFSFPNLAAVYWGRCQANIALGKSAEAVSDCSTVILLDTRKIDYSQVYLARGDAYVLDGKADSAIQDYRTVLTLSPDSEIADLARAALARLENVDSTITANGKCSWLVRAQLLVAERNTGAKRLLGFFLTYGTEGFDVADSALIEELVASLEELLPAQRNFIEQWKELDATPGEEGYWSMELDAQTLRLESLEEMYQALLAFDPDLLESGVEKFHTATSASRQAENAMLDLYQRCTAQ